jgi:hypothetical protein
MRPLLYLSLALSLFASTSCIEQGKLPKVPGVDGPHVNIKDGKIVLAATFKKLDLAAGFSTVIPKMEHSTAAISPALGGGTLIKVAFDPRDVESDHFRVVPSETLPDGRSFPFTIDGTLPALAINTPDVLDTTFYASNKLFGFFIPINLPKELSIPFDVPIRLKINGKQIGIVSYIAPDHKGEGSGMMLVLTLKDIQSNPDAQSLLKFSKKHPEALF